MAVVVDASAMAELLVRSPVAPQVEEAIVGGDAFAPELLDAEVASTIAGLERGGKLDDGSARKALKALLEAPVARMPHAGLLPAAWEHRANLSIYDALYVALARRLECPLLTGDRRLAAAPGLGVAITLLPVGSG